jgi:hypothetical protein
MVEFISYTGDYPNLCTGKLTLKVDDKYYCFGYDEPYNRFWRTTGSCSFNEDYSESEVSEGPWEINEDNLPTELKQYSKEILDLLNKNIPYGCCGGCL